MTLSVSLYVSDQCRPRTLAIDSSVPNISLINQYVVDPVYH